MSQTAQVAVGTLTLRIMSLPDDTYHDQIESYLIGEMAEKERKTFEGRMAQDEALQKAVAEMKDLQADMAALEKENFLAQLESIRMELEAEDSEEGSEAEKTLEIKNEEEESKDDLEVESEGKVRSFPRWYFAAAAVILLLIVPFYFILKPSPSLFEQNFEAYPDPYSSRGRITDELREAGVDYRDGKYAESIVHFDTHLEAFPLDSEAVFFSGVAHLAAGESEEAISFLAPLQVTGFLYSSPAQWYLALAYLQADQTDKAKPVLEAISKRKDTLRNKNSYREKASELLKELEE